MSPQFTPPPGGFAGQVESDHLDFLQAGWIHQAPSESRFGILQLRYGHSFAHLDTRPSVQSIPNQSRIELLGGAVTGAPPLDNLAVRTRQQIAVAWQPQFFHVIGTQHRLSVGGGWSTGAVRNRFTTPSGVNLITANAAPAFVVEYNTPLDSLGQVLLDKRLCRRPHRSYSHSCHRSRRSCGFFGGSLPAQSSPAGPFTPLESFRSIRPDLLEQPFPARRFRLARPSHSRPDRSWGLLAPLLAASWTLS